MSVSAHSDETFNASAKKGSASFGVLSASRLSQDVDKVAPCAWSGNGAITDPGLYDPNTNRDIVATAKRSFRNSDQEGKGGFGGTHKRELKLTNNIITSPFKNGMLVDGEETPAPGTHTPMLTETGREYNMSALNGTEKMKSASFATTTKRPSPALPSASAPGPGAYDPNFDAFNTVVRGEISKIGRDSKYTGDYIGGAGDDCTTSPHVGPGTYTAVRNKSGDPDTILYASDLEVLTGMGTNAVLTSGTIRTVDIS